MATVFKRGGKKASKGAVFMISWFDEQHSKWRSTTGYRDKDLSLAKGHRLEKESAARREGWTNDIREHAIQPIEIPLNEYLTHLRAQNRDNGYLKQHDRRIRRLLTEAKIKRLLDLDAPKIEETLLRMRKSRGFESSGSKLSATTRNEYVTSLRAFSAWAATHRRIDHDPLKALAKVDESIEPRMHPRRALTANEIAALLDAALRRPEVEHLKVRVGPDKGQLTAKVRPAILLRARKKGEERRRAYLCAVWTGLRRTELSELQWRDVALESGTPHLALRSEATKSGRPDVIPLHPQLADELRQHRPANHRPTDRVFTEVPSMHTMRRDLAFAGIDYGNAEIGFADLHAQRKTLNMLLATHNVDTRIRQAQLRHTDPRLTEQTYFDREQFVSPQAKRIAEVPAIRTQAGSIADGVPLTNLGIVRAQNAHETRGPAGHSGAQQVTEVKSNPDDQSRKASAKNLRYSPENGTKRHDPAPSGTGSDRKRAKGFEPSTFTLGTCLAHDANHNVHRYLQVSPYYRTAPAQRFHRQMRIIPQT